MTTPDVKADANDRASRTIGQGVIASIVAAVVLVVVTAAGDTDRLSGVDWGSVADKAGYAALVVLLTAAASWAQRVKEA